MEGLLTAMQNKLREIDTIRRDDVFLSPDPDIIPNSAKFPCIGLKDGKVRRSDVPGEATDKTLPVDIIVYEKLARDEVAIRTVLKLTENVHAQLKDDELAGYIKDVAPIEETPIRLMYREKALILRKIISYQYERREE